MSPQTTVVVALIAAPVGWFLVRAIFLPWSSCRWCGGSGTNWWSGKRRRGHCWFCGGEPWRMTRGARMVRRPFRRRNR